MEINQGLSPLCNTTKGFNKFEFGFKSLYFHVDKDGPKVSSIEFHYDVSKDQSMLLLELDNQIEPSSNPITPTD